MTITVSSVNHPYLWRFIRKMANGENGNVIKLNVPILIWLGGLTIGITFYAGISIEKLNNLTEQLKTQQQQRIESEKLLDMKIVNLESNLRALTISYTRGKQAEFIDGAKKRLNEEDK